MIYFSEVKSKKVVTEDGVMVGILRDLIFLATAQPRITKLVVEAPNYQILNIPITFLTKINSRILVHKRFETAVLDDNELYVRKNLLDKQIIDIQGNKIVRVNDVAIQNSPYLYIAGVDIGLLGILRQLKLEEPVTNFLGRIGLKISSRFLSWGDIQPIELARGKVMLKKEEQKLAKMRPEDLAGYLEKTNISNINKILRLLNEKFAAQVVENLNVNYQAAIFRNYKPERAAKLLSHIDPDEVVDVLLTLSPVRRQQIISFLPDKNKKKVTHLLKYSNTQIGKLLTTEYLSVGPDNTVREVIAKIRAESADFTLLNAIYVLNKNKQLIGVFNLHELLLQDMDTPVYKFMIQTVFVAHITTPIEITLNKMLKYRLQTLPIIDDKKQMQGMVNLSNIMLTAYKHK